MATKTSFHTYCMVAVKRQYLLFFFLFFFSFHDSHWRLLRNIREGHFEIFFVYDFLPPETETE